MFAGFIHDATSIRIGTPETRQQTDGTPYAVRRIVIGTKDGLVEFSVFSRTDSEAPTDMADHLDALAVREL